MHSDSEVPDAQMHSDSDNGHTSQRSSLQRWAKSRRHLGS
jgi:hypothetical protein